MKTQNTGTKEKFAYQTGRYLEANGRSLSLVGTQIQIRLPSLSGEAKLMIKSPNGEAC